MTVISEEQNRTSIRLKPSTKHFLDCQAKALHTSTHSVIGMILDGLAAKKIHNKLAIPYSMMERFFYLFEQHGLDMPSIVSVMKRHGFTLSALSDSNRLSGLLRKDAISHIARTFFVQSEWLTGASDFIVKPYGLVDWVEDIGLAKNSLINYAKEGLKPHVCFLCEKGNLATGDDKSSEYVGAVVRLLRKTDDLSFMAYDLWEPGHCSNFHEQVWALCDYDGEAPSRISVSGHKLHRYEINNLATGTVLPAVIMQRIGASHLIPSLM